ncbi:MAG: SLBB domain-containing protein [Bacteroidota bacterium]|nr:SLBB domain-containing protein [Bacteroidota bacterium]
MPFPRSIAAFLLVSTVIVFRAGTARAQILEPGQTPRTGTMSSQGGSYYNFSSGGTGCDLKVSVWGFVQNPGRYYIPCETNLLELMSFCGGPRKGARLDRVKIVRRGGPEEEHVLKEVFEVNLAKYLDVTDKSVTAPELLLWPGDLVVIDGVEESPVDMFLRIAQVVVAISSLVTATVAVINIAR